MSYGPPPPWPPQPAAYPYPPPPPPRRRRALWLPIVGAAVIVVLLATLAFVWFGRGSGEIFLEPAAATGPDPFTPAVATAPRDGNIAAGNSPAPAGSSASTKIGGEPGLYGGTRNVSSCDVPQLIGFLQANPALGQAWAQVQGISHADLPTYIGSLTSVVLRSDTRVTNHGFAGGRATPRQSVLQAGTAVLVDAYGVPRARCYCGNPLVQPAAVPVTPSYTGPRWAGFDPGGVTVVVQNTTIITVITLIDIDTGSPFDRPVGSQGQDDRDPGRPPTSTPTPTPTPTTSPPPLTLPPDVTVGQGDVQVTLLWQGPSDLDLRVTDPTGFTVGFTSPSAPSGGQLDVDANAGCGPADSSTHVENVFWPSGSAPPGPYSAVVNLYGLCGANSATYQLTVVVGGAVVDSRSGTLTTGESPPVAFTR